jgi:HD-like signal output (HDOD) protein
VPPFARHAQELLAHTVDPDGGAVQLARVVLKDLGLTTQLLRVANSSLYNRSGKRIISIPHAVALLGWDNVRNLAGAMRFVEHYAHGSPGLRQLMMFSLLTATHARQVAGSVGYARPEEAYVCGLLRNLGEVLIACYHGRQYASVLTAMQQDHVPLRTAAMQVFSFSFDDVALRLADAWNMPAAVRICLDGGATATTNEQKCLASVTSYGHELTSALYRYAGDLKSDPIQLRTVVNPQGNLRRIPPSDLRRIVDCASEDTGQTFATLHIPLESLRLDEQAERARHVLADGAPTSLPLNLSGIDMAIQAAAEGLDLPTFEVSTYIQSLLEALTDHGAFERALFALMSEERNSIRARLGSGMAADEAIGLFSFSLARNDSMLNAAIKRRHDLWVDRKADLRHEGSQVFAALGAMHAVVFPVVVDDVVAGVLYADRKQTQPPAELRSRVDQIRSLIAAAIARMRLSQ